MAAPSRAEATADAARAPQLVSSRARHTILCVALAVVIVVTWFMGLEQRGLWEPDEGRYAEIAREMVVSGDWVTPRLNDILYIEKPPLQYWATAAAFKAFGQHNWSSRLWSALAGLAGVLLAFHTGRRLHSTRAGFYGALILASSVLYFALAHLNTLDMGLTFFVELVVFAFALALRGGATPIEHDLWIYAAWVGAGLAVLSKGLIGFVLPAGALAAYSLAYRDWTLWRRIELVRGAAIMLLVAAPWFIAAANAIPDFLQFFFVHEHFSRFLTIQHHRYQPWWFFLPVLALGALPWTWTMLAGLYKSLKHDHRSDFQPFALLAVSACLVIVFFSASSSKMIPYVLPALPPLALCAARYICDALPGRVATQIFASTAVLALSIAAVPVAIRLVGSTQSIAVAADLEIRCWLLAATLIALASAVYWQSKAGKLGRGIATVAVSGMVLYQLLLMGAEAVAPGKSGEHLAGELKPYLTAATRVYALQGYPQSLPFYLGRTMTLVDFRGEFDFGLRSEPQKSIPTLEDFMQRWRRESDAIAVMPPRTYGTLSSAGAPMQLIARDAARVVVRRP